MDRESLEQYSETLICRVKPTTSNIGSLNYLPLEIRRMIYVAIMGERTLRVRKLRNRLSIDFEPRDTPSYPRVAFLQSCRQIYLEASDVLYKTNTFLIYYDMGEKPLSGFLEFSEQIPPGRLKSITRIRICSGTAILAYQEDVRFEVMRLWRQLWDLVLMKMPGVIDVPVIFYLSL